MKIFDDIRSPEEMAAVWEETHITDIQASNVRHKDVLEYIRDLDSLGLQTEEAGQSYGGRAICSLSWGGGPLRILMWSQMHGDEPTATSALMDLFSFLKSNEDNISWVERLSRQATILAVPMLNPDGAELFQRRNLQSIDINRDARRLETPEGRLLKKLRDEWRPEIGFNLHNQQELTSVSGSLNQATNSFLAVSGRKDGESYPGHDRNKRLCAVMIEALQHFIPGSIGRYGDDYNPRAFGDMIAAWGTPVILLETGGCHGEDEMFLVKLNFVAFLSALQSLVDGTEESADATLYESLPLNETGRLFNTIFKKALIVNFAESNQPFTADIAINRERRRADTTPPMFVQEIGDLKGFRGLDEYEMSSFYAVSPSGCVTIGSPGHLIFFDRRRDINWHVDDLTKVYAPDGEYVDGEWLTPLKTRTP